MFDSFDGLSFTPSILGGEMRIFAFCLPSSKFRMREESVCQAQMKDFKEKEKAA